MIRRLSTMLPVAGAALIFATALFFTPSCGSSDDGPTDVVANTNDNGINGPLPDPNNGQTPPAPYDQISWACEDVLVNNPNFPAGQQTRLLRNTNGDLFNIFFRPGPEQPVCNAAEFSDTVDSPTPVNDLLVAVQQNGSTTWSIETVDLTGSGDPGIVTSRFGIGAELTLEGQPVVSVAAGAGGLFSCGSSDLVVATRTGADTYTVQSPAQESADVAIFCGAPAEGETFVAGEEECCVDEACDSGTDVGHWSDVAVSPSGALAVVYTDTHNFGVEDAGNFQGVELWESGQGLSHVRPWSGRGEYAEAIFAGNNLVIAYGAYSGQGLYLLYSNADGGFDGVNGNPSGVLFQNFVIGERITMAVAPDGTLGIAFYVLDDGRGNERDLWYCESDDNGQTINVGSDCLVIEEPILRVGGFPSLAFDSESRPAISYEFCGADTSCSRDGLRYAWRDDTGRWWKFDVHNVDNNRSGQYTSLVFDPATNAPIIAFHDQTRGAAMLATGAFDGGGSGPCAVE